MNFSINPKDLGINEGDKENLKGKNAEYNARKNYRNLLRELIMNLHNPLL